MPKSKTPITWIQQSSGGCGKAALAMLLDTTYVRVGIIGPAFCEKCGIEEIEFDQFLAEHELAIQRLWRPKWYDGTKREVWPPKPWADRHVALVRQTTDDEDKHYVVMDRKGIVYDPEDTEFTPSGLDRYHEVEWVAAVYSIARPAPRKKVISSPAQLAPELKQP